MAQDQLDDDWGLKIQSLRTLGIGITLLLIAAVLTFGTFAFIDIGIFMAGRVRPGLFVSYNSFQCRSKMVDLGFRFIVLLSSMSQHEVVHEEVAQCGQLYRRPPSRDLVATC